MYAYSYRRNYLYTLHFSTAYGSVACMRSLDSNGVPRCSIVMAKVRLTPLSRSSFRTVPELS